MRQKQFFFVFDLSSVPFFVFLLRNDFFLLRNDFFVLQEFFEGDHGMKAFSPYKILLAYSK